MLTYGDAILFPVGICLFKVNSKSTIKRCEICPKLTKKVLENSVKYVRNSQKKGTRTKSIDMNTQLIDVALVSFFLTLNIYCFFSAVSCVNFERVNVSWKFCWYVLIIFKYCINSFFCVNLASGGVWQESVLQIS